MVKQINPWISHIMSTRNNLPPGTSYKNAMKLAKKTYKMQSKKIMSFVNPKQKYNKKTHKKYGRRKSRRMRGGEGETVVPPILPPTTA